ncbi:MAG TPA: SMC-Scp complex subunit ScpB [Alphaproteobacteria bacterium]|nr:SMC-Scp complex subunit ScpB [Alphaproteobacteria bacterium]
MTNPDVPEGSVVDIEAHTRNLRIVEAVLFMANEPVDQAVLAAKLPPDAAVEDLLAELSAHYQGRGFHLIRVAGKWAFRTAPDMAFALSEQAKEQRRLSRAAMETLAIIAYHQPVTRAEIEDLRGVSVSKGTLDVLLELGWIKMRGRRKVPGRPVTYGTTEAFLLHFGLDALTDLPGLDDMKAAGLLEQGSVGPALPRLPGDELTATEEPLDGPVEPDEAEDDSLSMKRDAAE